MRWVTSANVACGGHAGSVQSMEHCIRLAKKNGVRLGAHPGSWDRKHFGRGTVRITVAELELLLLQQVGVLERLAQIQNVPFHHIKLHGTLYHASETDSRLASAYADAVKRWWPTAKIYARAHGRVAAAARRRRIGVWEEVYVDRNYLSNGALVPRGRKGALITNPLLALQRAKDVIEHRRIEAISGERISARADTLCIHSDTPRATVLARALYQYLRGLNLLHRP